MMEHLDHERLVRNEIRRLHRRNVPVISARMIAGNIIERTGLDCALLQELEREAAAQLRRRWGSATR